MGNSDKLDLEPGTVLAGKFRIERVLGRGGMGVVVAARHLHLDEDVAIKFLLPEALESDEAVGRFEREARAAAKIRSEHVIRVSDVGRLDSGAPYMVMEHLTGVDLKQYLASTGPLPVDEAVHYVLQACLGLAEAHSLGIVHRDLKPANMFRIIRSDGAPCIKLLDFGISKLQDAEVSMTHTSMMMGSPSYMSPEQMNSAKDVDVRTDIWALGVITFQLLTSRVPFGGETIAQVCKNVLGNPAPRLSDRRTDVPEALQEVIDRALAKKRKDRFSSVAELSQALEPFGREADRLTSDRISRVLGVAPTEASPEVVKPAPDPGPTPAPAAAPTNEAEDDDQGSRTLEGAAHTQTEYRPPTRSSTSFWLIAVLVSSAAAAAVPFVTSQSTDGRQGSEKKEPGAPENQQLSQTGALEAARGESSKGEEQGKADSEGEDTPSATPNPPRASVGQRLRPKGPARHEPPPTPEPSTTAETAAESKPNPPPEATIEDQADQSPEPEPEPESAPAPTPKPREPRSFFQDRH